MLTNILTVDEVAAHLKISPKTVRYWITEGKIPAFKLGGCVRVSEDQLQVFIDNQCKNVICRG